MSTRTPRISRMNRKYKTYTQDYTQYCDQIIEECLVQLIQTNPLAVKLDCLSEIANKYFPYITLKSEKDSNSKRLSRLFNDNQKHTTKWEKYKSKLPKLFNYDITQNQQPEPEESQTEKITVTDFMDDRPITVNSNEKIGITDMPNLPELHLHIYNKPVFISFKNNGILVSDA